MLVLELYMTSKSNVLSYFMSVTTGLSFEIQHDKARICNGVFGADEYQRGALAVGGYRDVEYLLLRTLPCKYLF